MKKRIIVTGGAGFLGSHLCSRLIKEGNEVICIDNLFTGSKDNLVDLAGNSNFIFIEHDIVNPIDVGHVDQIYNLACPASPPHYQYDPIHTTQTSVWGILNMLEIARKHNARILQASTSEVYGDPEVHPQPEEYRGNVNPNGIRACYDEGKRMAESLMFDFHRIYGTQIKIIRIFNTYGPNMNPEDGRVVSNFIMQALNDEDITIYGTGCQTRSFCYVDDLIEGMYRLMNSDVNFTGPCNVGNPGEFTMIELAEKIIAKTGSKSKLVYEPLPSDDPTQRKPVIELAKEMLNWEPKVALDEGLDKTIEYFKKLN